ncbi:UNVERIFIED_CONTAM: hypothetical protein PYX00_006967 [Menopon gallinae]|uniref:C2H2-type domain-containing protein n=1 Tax=Menopon gallinae TaxID=328185 RepID=A0AAW2HGX1_9NEOP
MTTKTFLDIPEMCAEEICGSEDTVSASGDELLEQDFNPVSRSRSSSQEESGEELTGPPTTRSRADSGALLDMLAEVASQKLLFSPMKRKPGHDLRKSESENTLTVAQVKSLSTNQLIKLFSTTEFNEMKKLYSFQCTFNQNCQEKFISFGSENRAKEKFKQHLLQHLETLKVNDSEEVVRSTRKRRVSGVKRKKGKDVIKEVEELNEEEEEDEEEKKSWEDPFLISDLNILPTSDTKVEVEMVTEETTPVDLNVVAENSAALDLNKLIAGLSEKMGVSGVVGEHSYFTAEKPIKTESNNNVKQEEGGEQVSEVKVFHPSEELRHFMDIETKDTVMVCVLEGNSVVLKHLPPVGQQIDVESSVNEDNRPKVEYNVIRSSDLPVIANNRTNSPPPPTAYLDPSALWELNHGVNIERDEFQQARKPKGKAKFIGQSKIEKERALEAIEAIRKKTGGGGLDTLQCTICQPPRAFTAPTTLVSHYRSHAGIKPYECRICNAVFTRQHSLNYHMLIHANQTRFTCQDCGRKFRHPSHFKEHRRRHTGESPFECSDCLMRFKTRNTYKRHLRTRHGKVLTTSGGLIILSEDEFQMVRTVPRHVNNVNPVKRGRPRKVNSHNGEFERENNMYDETTIDAIDEDIQALHQLEIVTSHEGNYESYTKDASMDIDEMPVDFITDENDETDGGKTSAAYEEIVKEAVRLEKAEKESKLQQQQQQQQQLRDSKFVFQNKTYEQSDEETIIIETEDPLTGSGLYLATLEDGETVLVDTNEDDDDSNQEINLGFKFVEVGRPDKFGNQTLAEFSNQYLSEDEFSGNSNNEPTVIVIKNEPLS